MHHRKTLRDQVIVITGVSSGIGLATARMAARAGAGVVFAARSGDTLARIVREIEAEGGKAIADRAVAAFGGFDTWVNVAGIRSTVP